MGNPNNAATRLHTIISTLKRMPGTNPCVTSFAAVLQVPANNALLLERVGRVATLVRRSREQALASGISASDPHLEWLPVVEAAFYNLNLAGNLASFTEKIDAVNLERLRFCGLQIADRFGEPELAKEEIARVAREIEELIAEIKESPIDENARQYALHHLFQIAQALREYELFGAERIREEASTAIGSAFFQYKDAQGVGTKYWDLISKVCVLLQTGAAVVYIEQFTRSLLGK
jgi:hypothetical protein